MDAPAGRRAAVPSRSPPACASRGARRDSPGGVPRRLDQRPTHAVAPPPLRGEQVLQVRRGHDQRRAAVEQEVREPHELRPRFRDQGVHRLGRVEEALPGGSGHRLRKCRRPGAAVEGVVAVPERTPARQVLGEQGSDREGAAHEARASTPPSCQKDTVLSRFRPSRRVPEQRLGCSSRRPGRCQARASGSTVARGESQLTRRQWPTLVGPGQEPSFSRPVATTKRETMLYPEMIPMSSTTCSSGSTARIRFIVAGLTSMFRVIS